MKTALKNQMIQAWIVYVFAFVGLFCAIVSSRFGKISEKFIRKKRECP